MHLTLFPIKIVFYIIANSSYVYTTQKWDYGRLVLLGNLKIVHDLKFSGNTGLESLEYQAPVVNGMTFQWTRVFFGPIV